MLPVRLDLVVPFSHSLYERIVPSALEPIQLTLDKDIVFSCSMRLHKLFEMLIAEDDEVRLCVEKLFEEV